MVQSFGALGYQGDRPEAMRRDELPSSEIKIV